MDFNLTEQEKMLQGLAKDFAEKEVAPRAAEIDRTGQFPLDLAREIGKRGFQGLPYPEKYGGSGAGYVSFVLVLEQLCQASVSVGAIMAVNTVPEEGIYRFGNEEQKQRLLTPLASGQWLGGIGFTEPDTGSDPSPDYHHCPAQRQRLCYQRAENVHVPGAGAERGAAFCQAGRARG